MSMTGSVSGVDLPDYCLWLPHFDIDFCLETEFEDGEFTDKDAELLHLLLAVLHSAFSFKELWCSLKATKHNANN